MLSDFYHIGAIISVFLGLVIIIRKDKVLNNYILSLWLIVLGVNVFLFHRLVDHRENFQMLSRINYLLLIIQIPAPYLFVSSFFGKPVVVYKKILIHTIIPFLTVLTLLLLSSPDILDWQTVYEKKSIVSTILYVLVFLGMPVYLFLALAGIKTIKSITLEQVSDIINNDFLIIRRFIIGILAAFCIFIVIAILSFYMKNVTLLTALGSAVVILSLSVMYAGIFGMQRSELFVAQRFDKTSSPKRSPGDIKVLQEVIDKLSRCMIEKKPYLLPRLSLKELSEISLIAESQISSAINTVMKQNFYDYINSLRIEEFINRCKTKDKVDYTLTAIAFECGFNSKSTFFEIFKKQIGQTPSQFVKSL